MNSSRLDWELSICGLNCAKCEIYQASHGDNALLEELMNYFKENVDPNIQTISCEKCKGPTNKCWSDDCEMRSCAMKRNVRYCFECPDFICDILEKFANDGHDHHKRTVENMKKMKEYGVKKWISFHKEPQFCP